MKIIAVLGGWLQKDPATGAWKIYEQTNDHLRAIGGYYLLKRRCLEWKILVSGGNSRLRDASAPTIAALMKAQLLGLGLESGSIIEEGETNTTAEQLLMLNRLLEQNPDGDLTIVSNDWHLPRIAAMIARFPELSALRFPRVELVSAEEVLLRWDAEKWKEAIDRGRRSDAMGEIMDKERQGIRQINDGTYVFSVTKQQNHEGVQDWK